MVDILKELFDTGKIDMFYVRSLLDAMRIDLETYLYIIGDKKEEE